MATKQSKSQQGKAHDEVLKRCAAQAWRELAREVEPLATGPSSRPSRSLPKPSHQTEALWKLGSNRVYPCQDRSTLSPGADTLECFSETTLDENEGDLDTDILRSVLTESGAFAPVVQPDAPRSTTPTTSPSQQRESPPLNAAAAAFDPRAAPFTVRTHTRQIQQPPSALLRHTPYDLHFPPLHVESVSPYGRVAPAAPPDVPQYISRPRPFQPEAQPTAPIPPTAPRAMRERRQFVDKRFSQSRHWAAKKLAEAEERRMKAEGQKGGQG